MKFINMGEIFAWDRMLNVPCERAPLLEKELDTSLLEPYDLLFARQSLVLSGAGKCSIFLGDNEKVSFESHLIRVRLNQKLALPEFYYYLFMSPLGRGIIYSITEQGAGAAGIRGSDLSELSVPCPSIPEQKNIANLLSSVDDKIALNRQQNATLEAMAQALFRSWFVDFDPVLDKALAAGHPIPPPLQAKAQRRLELGDRRKPLPAKVAALFPDRFVYHEEVGWVPEGWAVLALEKVAKVKYGKDHKKLDDGDIPVFGSGGIMRYANQALYTKESILIPRKGSLNNIFYIDEAFWSVDTMFYTEISADFSAKYLFQVLKRYDFVAMNVGSAVPSMTTKVLNSLQVLNPGKQLLLCFDHQAQGFQYKTELNKTEVDGLINLRDTLLPKLISGELRVEPGGNGSFLRVNG